ncbi:MAG: TonB-dependent receptor [Cyclobacteriaceae bacterium]
MKNWLCVGVLIVSMMELSAQNITGTVVDEVSGELLVGATIQVRDSEIGTSTDAEGRYELNGISAGRTTIEVSYIGYQTMIINDVWVKSGQLTNQDIALKRTFSDLDEVVVTAGNTLSSPGRVSINEEQINRFAATYYDPARLATTAPDVMVTNDQNNQISVRGLSPNYNVWRLEGAEIINPNHLSNAGTFLDQPSATGGGVNMLSAQMLSNSEFLYSTFDNRYGNSVGGIFNMNLKNGNNEKKQFTAQVSLIGFDFASEGPVMEGSKATYAVNYRYSFTGLLANFGVDFGGESIGFQDLAFNVTTPVGKKSKLKFYGVGGLSFNDFEHKPYDESEVEKDRNDINYKNATGIIGLNLKNSFSTGSLNTTINFSAYDNSRKQSQYNSNDSLFSSGAIIGKQRLLSLSSVYSVYLGNGTLDFGALINRYDYDKTFKVTANGQSGWSPEPQYLIRPYTSYLWRVTNRLKANFGLSMNTNLEYMSLDPRLNINYQLGEYHTLSAGVGLYSQLLNPYNYLYDNPYGAEEWQNEPHKFLSSLRYVLGYSFERGGSNLSAELFYYDFKKARKESKVIFSEPYNQANAQTMGVSVSAEKSFSNQFYYRVGASLFDSEIAGQNTQFNSKYSANAAGGKEWKIGGESKNNAFSVNMKFLFQGGQYFHDRIPLSTVSARPSRSYKSNDFFRTDLRLMWTFNKPNRTSSIALDIQNVTNAQNESFRYYDSFTSQTETQYNLGLIPILTYRVEW